MTCFIVTYGTDGDIIPMISLGEQLIDQGHAAILIGEEKALKRFTSSKLKLIGIKTKSFAIDPSDKTSKEQFSTSSWSRHWENTYLQLFSYLDGHVSKNDVLISNSSFIIADLLAGAKKCTWVEIGLNCASFLINDSSPNTKPWTNQSWDKSSREFKQQVAKEYGLNQRDVQPSMRLLATPQDFQSKRYASKQCFYTGFWYTSTVPNYKDESHLTNLELSSESRYMVICFSSQAVDHPKHKISQYLELADAVGRKLIIIQNKSFHITNHSNLIWADSSDYLTILKHRPIVFTHGGIGSFTAALRTGCQIFIEPQTPEQLLNAYIAAELKLAYVVNSKTFNTYELARLINSREKFSQPVLDIPKSWFSGVKSAADLIINNLL